ncbi:leucine-rich repeats and immunoglobulin-like domains protein 3 [Harpegnathos saltator]|nr:leucine-rich repeats and immunoglobulin-like domains protein 3 [Harpegnathos saltator]
MKLLPLAFSIVILACWSKLSTVNGDYVDHVDETKFHCSGSLLSLNFSNAAIIKIGKDFIGSHLVTCLDLSNNQVETIEDGAFRKLPRLTQLYLSKNKFLSAQNLFSLGGHESLEVLVLNSAVKISSNYVIPVPGRFPNLEILSVSNNGFKDMIAAPDMPFPSLKILDLSNNGMRESNFLKLLPATLEHIYLQGNSLNFLRSLEKAYKVTTLTLDNNEFSYLRHHSNNPTSTGLWLYAMSHLRHLSLAKNRINTVESVAFSSPINLTYLNLSKNNINFLYPETFAKLQSLETLDLSSNQFQKIIDISSEMNITVLSLSCNKIQEVPQDAFKHMSKLRELSLHGNQIEDVHVNGFAYLQHLVKLDLSKNKLSSLPEGWTNAFNSLQLLDLSENQFTSLESLSLSNTLPLVEVYLVMNPLKYLDAGSFSHLPQNATVNLVHESHESAMRC